jgi:HD-GYP domain-containing protein (c-di-GMP phosphodiesterase class II)
MKGHVDQGAEMLEPIGGSLGRIIPIILAHHDKYVGSGYHATLGEDIPLEARVLSVADVYDSLASDRPYRKAMSPFEAKEIIAKGEGTQFDPRVVKAFNKGEMEVPHLVI